MQLYISIGLVLLIATTVKTLTNPGAFSKPLFTKVTKREDKFCTNGGLITASRKSRERVAYLYMPQEKDIDRDIFIVTNKGFETACSQDVGRSTS
ncbi:hypothetical protein PSTT_14198 [Puccinia striiformis]|uniref:Uncharacterized protein n=1 Tax=Puccinia striiformis TaxID=27350 RepID=A0A2S4UNF6_9BASI|nr:hypothetical protein PSTT_14198 [Puccinia striiformis]